MSKRTAQGKDADIRNPFGGALGVQETAGEGGGSRRQPRVCFM